MNVDKRGRAVLNKEEFDELDSMLNGIASRYHGWAGLDARADIVPELWCKVLPIIASKNEINMNYLARACYFKCIDLYNGAKKTNDKQFPAPSDGLLINDKLSSSATGDNLTLGTVDDLFRHSSGFDKINSVGYTDSVLADELLDFYEDGTPEKTYIVMVLKWSGMIPADPEEVGYKCKEYKFARACGYASDTSSGYRNFKWRVRADLRKFFSEGSNHEFTGDDSIYDIMTQ